MAIDTVSNLIFTGPLAWTTDAACVGQGLPQDREVVTTHLVGRVRRQALRQRRRVHHIGEQERYVLGGHRPPSAKMSPN